MKNKKNQTNDKQKLIEVKKVVKEFKNGNETTRILNGVDLEIYKGDFTVIMGPSG